MDLKRFLDILVLAVLSFESISASLILFDSNWKDISANSTDSIENLKDFRYYVSGFDYDNRPVVIMDWGKWNIEWLIKQPDLKNLLKKNYENYINELASGDFTQKMSKYLSSGQNSSDEVVIIKNYDAFDIRHVYTSESFKLCMDLLKQMQKCFHKIEYGMVVNANAFTYQLLDMGKPLIGNILSKFDVYGTNPEKWIPRLSRKIPLDQLPHSLGGREDFQPLLEQSFLK
ncbi:unnamed protein product [Allacma fusca]|uniref:CRAL-TRIO domain-containing protein n=1 Tax=Allacma fusca TaxID=39272 RepID=A0A8J2LG27_9HEXA|nr:unnamed protein product [Allacma fusca]